MAGLQLREAFGFLIELPNDAAERFAALLGVDARTLADVPLTRLTEPGVREAWPALVAGTVVDSFEDWSLLDLFPGLGYLEGQRATAGVRDTRVRNILRAHCDLRWDRVRTLNVTRFLSLPNAGYLSAQRLVAMAAVAGVEVLLQREPDQSQAVSVDPPLRPLQYLAAWGYAERGLITLGELLDDLSDAHPDVPVEMAERWERQREIPLADLGRPFRRSFDLPEQVRWLRGVLDERHEIILFERCVRHPPSTLAALGHRYGVTRERIRQLETRARTAILERFEQEEVASLRRVCGRLRARLGAAVPAERLGNVVRDALPPALREASADEVDLLVWLAGPYDPVGRWRVAGPKGEFVKRSEELVAAATASGHAPLEEVERGLVPLGLDRQHVEAWLNDQPGYRVLDQDVVRWGGSLADRATIVLAHRGEPLSRGEISAVIPEPHSVQTLANYLFSDERFLRVDRDRYGLAEWGGTPYRTILDALKRELEARGGEAAVSDLVETIVGAHDVSPHSVRSYASSHHFVRTRPGFIRARHSDEAPERRSHRELAMTRGCFSTPEGWTLRLVVSGEHLRGSGMPIPAAFAELVGVEPGTTKLFAIGGHTVRISWTGLQPAAGSIRALLGSLGAGEGDRVFLATAAPGGAQAADSDGGAPDGSASEDGLERLHVRHVEMRWFDDARPLARLAMEMGRPGIGSDEHLAAEVAAGLALDGPEIDLDAIRLRLLERREPHLAALLAREPHVGLAAHT